MRPLRIDMKGFGAFREETEIDLTGIDLVALVGPTGSGKSTIIDAITFALYGSVARYQDDRLVAPAINTMSNQAVVKMTFELDGSEHVAVRVVRRQGEGASTKEARLERGGDVLAADARTMTGKVEELLGLDVAQFNRTVVLPQGRFADFLHATPSERQKTIRQLLGYTMFERIGRRARERAKTRQNEVDILRGDLDDDAAELTDDHRLALADAVAAADELYSEYTTAHKNVARLDEQRASHTATADDADERLERLGELCAPDGIDELAANLSAAEEAATAAANSLADATQHRRDAQEAVAAGPDPAEITIQIAYHDDRARAGDDLADLNRRVEAVSAEAATAAGAVEEIEAEQGELDAAANAASETARSARDAVSQHRTVGEVDELIARHADAAAARQRLTDAETAADEAGDEVSTATKAAVAAADAMKRLADIVTDATERAGIAAYADHLTVGEPCPLCTQNVDTLPDHPSDADAELADFRHQHDVAELHHRDADAELGAAADRAKAAAATRDAERANVERAELAVADIDDVDELHRQRATAERLAGDVERTEQLARDAEGGAQRFRNDSANVAAYEQQRRLEDALVGLDAQIATKTGDCDRLDAQLADIPSRDDCQALAAEADQRARALKQADEAERVAHTRDETAGDELDRWRQRHDTARRELVAARDSIADIGAPAVADGSVADGWVTLLAHAANKREHYKEQQRTERAAAERLGGDIDEITTSLRRQIAAVFADVDDDDRSDDAGLGDLGELIVKRHTKVESELKNFDEQRNKLAEKRERITKIDEQRIVAHTLGTHLTANRFEGWLMGSALEELAARATTHLFDMSRSHYSLVLDDDRSFYVLDHANADERRSARTLSGGETFLASLSLALALADVTVELASTTTPPIDAIFLDEGFGTLDADTLDIVADAIEELGASGRMVGIVTHIDALAERMPAQLKVQKTSGSATVERVEL